MNEQLNFTFADTQQLVIRAPMLRRALISGIRRVIAQRDFLNKINVYPVPDGDTGSNMAFTLGNVLTGALHRKATHAGDLLRRVSEHAIDGARGNSGAILAQFFTGVSEFIGNSSTIDMKQMAQAVQAGALSAKQALSQPQEGTILSVIHSFANALQTRVQDGEHFQAWFAEALHSAQKALANTPNQLPVLMKAGVVDAGAQGFVDLLEGVHQFILDGKIQLCDDLEQHHADIEVSQAHREFAECDPTHRFCSECLLLGENLDRANLRKAIDELGAACVVIAGSSSRVRIHAHVAKPKHLFDIAARFGQVENTKVDDMQAQARSAANASDIVIITDTSADIPDALAEQLNIHWVACRISFGDSDYMDKIGLSTAEFYHKLRTESVLPKTSQPSPGDFRRQFEFLLSHHQQILYIGLSGAVSGTIQSAQTAAKRGNAERIGVFDSRNTAGGLGLMVIEAAKAAKRGESLEFILKQLERQRDETQTYAMPVDVSHIARGGRLPKWIAQVIQVIRLTPIARISPIGKLAVVSGFFGQNKRAQRFANYVCTRLDLTQKYRVIVSHCDDAASGQELMHAIQQRMQCEFIECLETGPGVGAHAGPGALVLSLQPIRAEHT